MPFTLTRNLLLYTAFEIVDCSRYVVQALPSKDDAN